MKNTMIIGLKELREHTEDFIRKVEEGKTFTVVRRSRPIFKIAPVDAWGDEGVWETVINFQQIDKNGISAKQVLRSLRKHTGPR